MDRGLAAKTLAAPCLFMLLIGLIGIHDEGPRFLFYFLNLEALALTFGGLFLFLWSAYPLSDLLEAFRCGFAGAQATPEQRLRAGRVFGYAADCSNGVGILVAVFALIMVMWGIDDLVRLPRRLAMCLYSVFLGQILAKAVFGPIARRLS